MPDESKRERRFSEEEVALIIKHAAELQQTEESEQESGGALSLSEIEQIAREAGIEPTLVRRAALGLDNPLPTNRPSPWLGAPTRLVFEKVVDGEIPIEEFETIIAEVRRTFGDNGLPSIIGRSLAWSSGMGGRRRGSGRHVDVSVVVRGGATTIRVEEEYRNIAGALFGGIVGGGGGGSTGAVIGGSIAAFHSAPLAVAIWVAVVGGFYTLARTIYVGVVGNRERELKGLSDRLEEMVMATARTPQQLGPGSGLPVLPGVNAADVTP